MEDYKPDPVEDAPSPSPKFQWPLWQKIVLGLLILFAVFYVLVDGDGPTPTPPPFTDEPTPPWPTVVKSEPTPTWTPSPTPGPTATPTLTATPSPTPTETPIVVTDSIQALGRLETVKYVMKTVVDLKSEPSSIWEQILGTEKLLLIAAGEVVAGFDLEKITEDDIVVKGTTVILTLPTPEILFSRLDNEKTYIYLWETGGIFQDISPELEREARRLGEEQIRHGALESDILSQAEEFGRFYLENFLQALGFTEIRILVPNAR